MPIQKFRLLPLLIQDCSLQQIADKTELTTSQITKQIAREKNLLVRYFALKKNRLYYPNIFDINVGKEFWANLLMLYNGDKDKQPVGYNKLYEQKLINITVTEFIDILNKFNDEKAQHPRP